MSTLLTRAQNLREETLSATANDVPTLGLSIIDGLLLPLSLIEGFLLRDAKSAEAREGVRGITRAIDPYFDQAMAGLKAAASALGRPSAAVPATGLAIDTFLGAIEIRDSLFEKVHSLYDEGNAAFGSLDPVTLVMVMELAGRVDQAIGRLVWLRDLRRSSWRVRPGVCDLTEILMYAMKTPPQMGLDIPKQEESGLKLGVARGNAALLVIELCTNAFYHRKDAALPVPGYIRDEDYVGIYFEDDGEGFSAETKARCFDPFYRGISAQESTEGARIGIGLTLVKIMADRVGGRVEFGSIGGCDRPVLFLPAAAD